MINKRIIPDFYGIYSLRLQLLKTYLSVGYLLKYGCDHCGNCRAQMGVLFGNVQNRMHVFAVGMREFAARLRSF